MKLLLLFFQNNAFETWYKNLYYKVTGGEISSILFVLLVIGFIYTLLTRSKKEYHSSWNILIDELDYSTLEFYKILTEELKLHGIKYISISKRSFFETSILSNKRKYLEVEWNGYRYYICAAPFGNGFFVSWWLFYRNPILKILISKIPYIGRWLTRKLYPVTFYKIDTASMFMTYAHQSVQTAIERISKEKGVRALTELERKPILNNIFNRK